MDGAAPSVVAPAAGYESSKPSAPSQNAAATWTADGLKHPIVPCLLTQEVHVATPPRSRVSGLVQKSVVLVAMYDPRAKDCCYDPDDVDCCLGTGFVVDKELGLVVTAAHVLYHMDKGDKFGTLKIKGGRIVIGVISEDNEKADFCYDAEVVAHAFPSKMDACVLRIISQLEHDVTSTEELRSDQPYIPRTRVQHEDLKALKLAFQCKYAETVRVIGFSQPVKRAVDVNRSVDVMIGSVSFQLVSSCSNSHKEIVIDCVTIGGQSGGPCVNEKGEVVGILTRGSRRTSYLVPCCEFKNLVDQAGERILLLR